MVGLAPSILNNTLHLIDGSEMTVAKYLLSHDAILSMEPTYLSESTGRYIFIVKKAFFQEARRFIQEFCVTHFYTMLPTTQERDDYKTTIQSLPHIYESTPLGGAVKSRVDVLCEYIKQIESEQSENQEQAPINSWTQRG